MATTLKSIMGELDKYYAPSSKLLNQQLAAIPKSTDAAVKGLDAKLAQANTNILDQSRARGLGFSGIPIQEQAQYAATEYAPALANLKSGAEQNRLGILESLNQLGRDRRGQAQSIYDTNRNFAEQQRQFNAQQALAREQMRRQAAQAAAAQQASAASYLAALQNSTPPKSPKKPKAQPRPVVGSNGKILGYDTPTVSAQTQAGWKQQEQQEAWDRAGNSAIGKYGPLALFGGGWLWGK